MTYILTQLIRKLVTILVVSILLFTHCMGEESASVPATSKADQLESLVELSTLTQDEKAELTAQLQLIKKLQTQIKERAVRVGAYESIIANANSSTEKTDQNPEVNVLDESALRSLTLEQLKNQESSLVAERESFDETLKSLQKRQTDLIDRPASIAEELKSARSGLENYQEDLSLFSSDKIGLKSEVAKLLIDTKQADRKAAIDDLQSELATIPQRLSILSSRLENEQKRIEVIRRNLSLIQSKIAHSKLTRAEAVVTKAQKEVDAFKDSDEGIVKFANENLALAKNLKSIVKRTAQAEGGISKLKKDSVRMLQSSETVQRVLSAGSLTDDLGELLRQVRSGLPNTSVVSNALEINKQSSISGQLNLVLWQEKLRGLSKNTLENTNTDDVETLLELPASLIQARRTLLDALIEAIRAQLEQLTEERIALENALSTASNLESLLDRRLLWLPSNTGLMGSLGQNLVTSVSWLLSPSNWKQALNDFFKGIKKAPIITILLFLPFILFALQSTLKRALLRLSKRVGNVNQDNYWTTPIALLVTLCLALPIPLLIGIISSILASAESRSEFTVALSSSLAAVSSLLLILILFRVMTRREGLFKVHFDWSDETRQNLRSNLYWFIGIQALVTILFVMSVSSGLSEIRYGIGLVAFLVSSIAIAILGFLLVNPKIVSARNDDNISISLLTWIALLFLVIVPLAIGISSLFGYFDTAVELQTRVFQSGILLLGVLIVFGVLMRMSLISQRRFALKKARERRLKIESERREAERKGEASGEAVPVAVTPEIKIDAINEQSKRILRVLSGVVLIAGLWWIWSQILPALGIITEITLWEQITLQEGVELRTSVTLWNVLLALIVLIGGIIAARNIRGVLEIGLFQRFNLEPGTRYAVVTIAGYLLVGFGIVAGFSQLGLNWSKLQWIVAALGVGLGFGLQEIVANFVSGLIILFERPVRVGDTVTIGTLSGTVSNIKIRATTVTDFDNREVLLPNKSIITENVTNWTLNNTVTRLVINIGVAYGSNIDTVRNILKSVIDKHPDILKTPPATVFFISHGDSSLDFVIRVFVDTTDKRMPVTHDINTAINAELEKNGIEIPFPQRDVHMYETKT